jgi:hypothetical protein
MPEEGWHLTEAYRSAVSFLTEALKMLVLINGGAAVAVLTYLGNLATRTAPTPLPHIRPALICYCAGVAVAAMGFIFAYLTQMRLQQEAGRQAPGGSHTGFATTTFMLAMAAVLAFVLGTWFAANALAP